MGSGNTAIGFEALQYNETDNHTAVGSIALGANYSVTQNGALGDYALYKNYDGSYNTATGFGALKYDVHGSNTDGINALLVSTASNNTGIGANALINATTGTGNIALGCYAGKNVTTGSNNIEIGNIKAAEGRTIRIGTQGTQNRAFVAGIGVVTFMGPDVIVNTTTGQLGYVSSSARFKRNIRDMGEASRLLIKLRPVTFIYKGDPSNIRQYGLVAEEVRLIYPDLITYDTDGRVAMVRYSAH